jgi:DNA polymerase I
MSNSWGWKTSAEGGSLRWVADYQRLLVNAFVEIEMTGFPFSPSTHQEFIAKAEKLFDEYKTKLLNSPDLKEYLRKKKLEEFNLGSSKDLSSFLFGRSGLNLEPVKESKKTNKPSADKESLKKYAEDGVEFAKDLLVLRNYTKLLNTFGTPLLTAYVPSTGAVHPSYFLAKVTDGQGKEGGTATGRLSCKSPNLQQLPKRDKDDSLGVSGLDVRKSFIPFPGHLLVEADQSQIEVRVAGIYSNDAKMAEFFIQGGDFHTRTAAKIYNIDYEEMTEVLESKDHILKPKYKSMRSNTKTIVFGIMYGMGLKKLLRSLGLTEEEGKEFIEYYFGLFPEFTNWRSDMIDYAKNNNIITTLFGRPRVISIHEIRTDSGKEERIGINTPIQSAAADITLYGLSRIWERLVTENRSTCILGTVHDSIIFSVDKKEFNEVIPWISRYMIKPPGLEWLLDNTKVPLSIEISVGTNWKDMKPIDLSLALAGKVPLTTP